MSDLRFRGRDGRSDAPQFGYPGYDGKPGEDPSQQRFTNVLHSSHESTTAMIWARLLFAVWWYFSVATFVWPICIHHLLGGSLTDIQLLSSAALLICHWSFRSSKASPKTAGRSKKPSTLSSLYLLASQAALPLLSFYLSPYKWLVVVSTFAYSIYASSLLLLPYPDVGQRVWFVALTVAVNLSALAPIAMQSVGTCSNPYSAGLCRERGCVGAELAVSVVACLCASVFQGLSRSPVTSFHFPSLQIGRWRRLVEVVPALVQRALALALSGLAAALVLLWVVGLSAQGDMAIQLQGLVICGTPVPMRAAQPPPPDMDVPAADMDGLGQPESVAEWGGESEAGARTWVVWWVASMGAPWVALVSLVVFSGLLIDAALQVLLTQGMSFQDEQALGDEGKVTPLLDAVLRCSTAPTVVLPASDALSRYHFMRVHCFRELDQLSRATLRSRVLFQSETLLPAVLQHHLLTLRALCDGFREILAAHDRLYARDAAPNAQPPSVLQGMVWGGGSEGELALLSRRLHALLASTDLHTACVASLASMLTESQRLFRTDNQSSARTIDARGIAVRSLGPVLCQLLDCAVQCEALVASDAYVPPALKVALKGNQMFRPPVACFAAALELAIYSIVVTFYMAIPDVLGQAGAECGAWITWSDKPKKAWKEQYLPRLQCYLSMSSAVLPAGEPKILFSAPIT